jgi:hypothetical protein
VPPCAVLLAAIEEADQTACMAGCTRLTAGRASAAGCSTGPSMLPCRCTRSAIPVCRCRFTAASLIVDADSPTGAFGLYQRAGFAIRTTSVTQVKDVDVR